MDIRPQTNHLTGEEAKKTPAGEKQRKERTKKRNKAIGLKATFVLPNSRLLLTSFGKGNDAVCESIIEPDGEVKKVRGEQVSIQATPEKTKPIKKINVEGRMTSENQSKGTAYNPMWQRTSSESNELTQRRVDRIGLRDKLEKMCFGKTFDDNIHIQIAYAILDIDKLLSVYINNIVYEINNMLRREGAEYDDIIGSLGLDERNKTYDDLLKKRGGLCELFEKLYGQRQLSYFNTILRDESLCKAAKRTDASKADIEKEGRKKRDSYVLLCVLGMMRQAMAHGRQDTRTKIYRFELPDNSEDEITRSRRQEARKVLDSLYDSRIRVLNTNFLKYAKVDVIILGKIYTDKTPEKIANEYYQFLVWKDYKNLGFSVKNIREQVMARVDADYHFSQTLYDSVRPRLNRLTDFVLTQFYKQHEDRINDLVGKLRASETDARKEECYDQEAQSLVQSITSALNKLSCEVQGEKIASLADGQMPKTSEQRPLTMRVITQKVNSQATYFTKMMYLLSRFQDGKEINDLFTQLINRFEVIASFQALLKAQELETEMADEYKLFEKSGTIARELRLVNSFARMEQTMPQAKKELYVEAAQALGFAQNAKDVEIEKEIAEMLHEEDENGKTQGKFLSKGKKDNGFRNFIANNVIESDRFNYLARYCTPARVRKLARHGEVIALVLKDIPDTQIKRYYDSAIMGRNQTNEGNYKKMREELARKIAGISFEDFKEAKSGLEQLNQEDRRKEAQKKVMRQAIVRLYLTVMYLLVKNLVYINSRYFLAFHCLERDAMIADEKTYTENTLKNNYACYAQAYLEANKPDRGCEAIGKKPLETVTKWEKRFWKKWHSYCYRLQNIKNSDPWALQAFRNKVEHLAVIRNADEWIEGIQHPQSYFEIYHYMMQRCIMQQFDHDSTTKSNLPPHGIICEGVNKQTMHYFDLVKKYGTYCKDFVKALNAPFAYNLPRYKNLSIDGLFDRNRLQDIAEDAIACAGEKT